MQRITMRSRDRLSVDVTQQKGVMSMGQSNRQWELQLRAILKLLEKVLVRMPPGSEKDDLQEIADMLNQALTRP